jgi:hypothetical protein
MAFEMYGLTWEGAFTDANKLEPRSGVYMVWCKNGEQWSVMDVGESANVQERVLNHDRAPQWKQRCRGVLHVAAHYTPNAQQAGRREIEKRLREITNPPCGDR